MEREKDVDVLFVEDSLDDSEFTEFALTKATNKIKFVHLRDGADALNFIFGRNRYAGQKAQSNLKFVILDIGLPSMSGLDVLRMIRAEKSTRRLPVIILSSSTDQEDIEVAYHLGANSYVVKPNGFEKYVKKVESLAYYWCAVNEKVA